MNMLSTSKIQHFWWNLSFPGLVTPFSEGQCLPNTSWGWGTVSCWMLLMYRV